MKKITALYSKGKNYTLYSESVGKKTVFQLHASFKEKNAVLYIVGDRFFRLPLSSENRATVSGDIRFNSAFLVVDGAIVAESGLNGERHARERIKSMILNHESVKRAEEKEVEAKNEIKTEPSPESESEKETESEYQSQAIQEILKKARELFSFLEQANGNADNNEEETGEATEEAAEESFNPFPTEFPNASFKERRCPRSGKVYLEGRYENQNGEFQIWAKRGEYSSITPRMRKNGFKRFKRASDGSGYWLKIVPKNR